MNIDINGVYYRRSLLDKSITPCNYEAEGVFLTDISYKHADYLIGVNGLSTKSFTIVDSAPDDCITLEQLLIISKGHWISRKMYNEVERILFQYDLQSFTSTIIYSLLVHRLYLNILKNDLPEFEKHGVIAVSDLANKIEENDGCKLVLRDPNRRVVYELTSLQTRYLAEILNKGVFETEVGKCNIEHAVEKDNQDLEFYRQVESLGIKNRANTSKKLISALTQRLDSSMHNKVKEPTNRALIIGKLFVLMGWCKEYNQDFHFDCSNERQYYYNQLKHAIL